MARLTIESQAAPAVQGMNETSLSQAVEITVFSCLALAVANPGILVGVVLSATWRWLGRPPEWLRVLGATTALAVLVALQSFLVPAWPWRLWLSQVWPSHITPVAASLATRSFWTEALAGPMWFEVMLLMATLWQRRLGAQIRHDHHLDQQRWRAISGEPQPVLPLPIPVGLLHGTASASAVVEHPEGQIRIGIDAETERPLDLELPVELATHVFLPGASGSGKTTTLASLADGALANGYGLVIVECKGGGLSGVARRLATRHRLPFQLVDPDDPASLGYNPCSGDAAAVANKLVGAFTFSPAAEIYKSIAMETIPVVVRGLMAAGQPVTLQSVSAAFQPQGMARLAHLAKHDRLLAERLLDLGDRMNDRIGRSGYAGLRHRLGALLEGKFGDLFRVDGSPVLDWDRALAAPSVTYIALSTLASSEDVELMGRVIAQDLKQVCARRIREEGRGAGLRPVLTIFDEFAALNEAEQLVDLLLQARQASVPIVISTQYLPESIPLRKACLGAGLLIAHRLEGEDAEAIANQLGTRMTSNVTHQIDYMSGYAEKGSIRREDRFNVSPNELRTFRTGQAVIRSVAKRRYSIVRVLAARS